MTGTVIIYLGLALLTGSCCLPTQRTLTGSDEQPSTVGIHGISACKVYPCRTLLYNTVGSYPTFSPSPSVALAKARAHARVTNKAAGGRKLKAVILCGTVCFAIGR